MCKSLLWECWLWKDVSNSKLCSSSGECSTTGGTKEIFLMVSSGCCLITPQYLPSSSDTKNTTPHIPVWRSKLSKWSCINKSTIDMDLRTLPKGIQVDLYSPIPPLLWHPQTTPHILVWGPKLSKWKWNKMVDRD